MKNFIESALIALLAAGSIFSAKCAYLAPLGQKGRGGYLDPSALEFIYGVWMVAFAGIALTLTIKHIIRSWNTQ